MGIIASLILIAALFLVGFWLIKQKGFSLKPTPKKETGQAQQEPQEKVEAPDLSTVTTVREYKYVPAERLQPVKGVSNYEWNDKEKILKFSFNVWIGWLPIVAANHGMSPNTESIFYKKHGFKVELILIDDPVTARDSYAAGKVHALWGTVDMMVLFAPELLRDSRTAPRVFQQIDWSNGGDGIVVRNYIKTVRDLKGKTIVCAQNSPSEYFITTLLMSAGMGIQDVKMKYTSTAFEAAAAFVADKSIDACVSWAPDIYRIPEKIAGTRILSSTQEANKVIADVYAFRADFCRDHPDIVAGFVEGVFEGMDYAKDHLNEVSQWMADAYGMKPEDITGMMNDAHLTNFSENVQFFLNQSNPTNFERSWKNASLVYRELNRIDVPIPFDKIVDFSVIQDMQRKGMFANQKDESVPTFTPQSYEKVKAEAPILTQTIRINFYPNSSNLYELARDDMGMPLKGRLYDPNVDGTLERVARLSGQFGRCMILITGHTDSSMKGRVPYSAVKQLSMERADAVKNALIQKYKFDPNKFIIEGKAWDEAADASDPDNQPLNRRVEIRVLPPEAGQ
jgi:NitT/TauT family transport system substrate-binding protein